MSVRVSDEKLLEMETWPNPSVVCAATELRARRANGYWQCDYCKEYAPSERESEEHTLVCPVHPMRAVEKERDELAAKLAALDVEPRPLRHSDEYLDLEGEPCRVAGVSPSARPLCRIVRVPVAAPESAPAEMAESKPGQVWTLKGYVDPPVIQLQKLERRVLCLEVGHLWIEPVREFRPRDERECARCGRREIYVMRAVGGWEVQP